MSGRKKENPEVELREEDLNRLRKALASVPDHRRQKNPLYPQDLLLTILVYSTLCDYDGGTGATRYCGLHADTFQEVFGLDKPPAATTFNKVIDCVDRVAVAEAVELWSLTCPPDIRRQYAYLCDVHIFESHDRKALQPTTVKFSDLFRLFGDGTETSDGESEEESEKSQETAPDADGDGESDTIRSDGSGEDRSEDPDEDQDDDLDGIVIINPYSLWGDDSDDDSGDGWDDDPDQLEPPGIRYPLLGLVATMFCAALCYQSDSDGMRAYLGYNKDNLPGIRDLTLVPRTNTFDTAKALLNPPLLMIPLSMWIRERYPDERKCIDEAFLASREGAHLRAAAARQTEVPSSCVTHAFFEDGAFGLLADGETGAYEADDLVRWLSLFNLSNVVLTMRPSETAGPVIKAIQDAGGDWVLPVAETEGKIQEAVLAAVRELQAKPTENPRSGVETWFDERPHVVYSPKKGREGEEPINCTLLDAQEVLDSMPEEYPLLRTAAHVAILDPESGEDGSPAASRILLLLKKAVTPEDIRNMAMAYRHIEKDHWLLDLQPREDPRSSGSRFIRDFDVTFEKQIRAIWQYSQRGVEKKNKERLKSFFMHNMMRPERVEPLLKTCALPARNPG